MIDTVLLTEEQLRKIILEEVQLLLEGYTEYQRGITYPLRYAGKKPPTNKLTSVLHDDFIINLSLLRNMN
jgi:hypothetical protein